MGERQRQDEQVQLHQGMKGQVENLILTGKEGTYRVSRIEGFGIFPLPGEFVWRSPGLIAPEDRDRLFTKACVHVAARFPHMVALEMPERPKRRKRQKQHEQPVIHIPGSTLLTLNLSYPTEWGTSYHVETRLHLEGEQAMLHRSRKVEIPDKNNGEYFFRHVTLHEDLPRPATLQELQTFDAMLRHVRFLQYQKERIQKAITQPLHPPLASTEYPIRHF